jgi:hypothetical protein
LKVNCSRTPLLLNPSEKFSRRAHWNSPPIVAFLTGVQSKLTLTDCPELVRVGRQASDSCPRHFVDHRAGRSGNRGPFYRRALPNV